MSGVCEYLGFVNMFCLVTKKLKIIESDVIFSTAGQIQCSSLSQTILHIAIWFTLIFALANFSTGNGKISHTF